MYVGSTKRASDYGWAYDRAQQRVVWRELQHVPALLKIFDEVLVNALDNTQRDPRHATRIDVDIDQKSGALSVRNVGRPIPVVWRDAEELWLPEMVFGELYTGSNFDDTTLRTVGGRHGFGAKLANIFSTSFEVEIADSAEGRTYSQR